MASSAIASLTVGVNDPILLWNAVAIEADRVNHTTLLDNAQTGPTRSSRALAIVHLAMYDAFAGVVNDPVDMPRYIDTTPLPPGGSSEDAAVAAAAHATLSDLFPHQQAFFDLVFQAAGDPADPGQTYGLAVAAAILADRANDPLASNPGYTPPSTARGKHRPDPDNPGQGYHGAHYGADSKGFAITDRFELAPPPFDNAEYVRALRQVRGRGIAPELMGTLPDSIPKRTPNQTLAGIYWAYDGMAEIGTPPRQYNQIIRCLAMSRSPGPGGNPAGTPNTPAQNAKLFALVNTAMADAGILAWDQKYIHNLWRPVVGIREHDGSFGPNPTETDNDINHDADPQWLPLGAPRSNRAGKNVTPPFPAYPSGHATFGAAAFHIARLFYNVPAGNRAADDLFDGLSFVSDEFNGVTTDNKLTVRPRHDREFPGGLWQMIIENGRSRVYLGVHWVFDAFLEKPDGKPDLGKQSGGKFFGGVPLGLQIAEDIFAVNNKAPAKSTVLPRP